MDVIGARGAGAAGLAPDLSVVLPIFNGAQQVATSVERLVGGLGAAGTFEIVLVDDGSTDGTRDAILRAASADARVVPVLLDRNQGKGAAVTAGMVRAGGRVRVFTDVDVPFGVPSILEIRRRILAGEADVIAGDRRLEASDYYRHIPLLRRFASFAFSALVWVLAPADTLDTQCGLKGFDGAVAARIFPLLRERGFAFDAELLFLCRKFGVRVAGQPVSLVHAGPSTVSVRHVALPMLASVAKFRPRWLGGAYADPALAARPGAHGRADDLALLAAFLAPLALRVLSYTDRILDRDEAYWAASAMRARAFGVPAYVSGWDIKPPLVLWFHHVAGALSPGAPLFAAHVMTAVLAATACAILFAVGRRLGGTVAGITAALAFAAFDSAGPARALASYSEPLVYVPVALAALALVSNRPRGTGLPLVLGAVAGLAALTKQPAAAYGPAFVAAAWFAWPDRRSARFVAWSVAGALGTIAAAFAFLALRGAWSDFIACNVTIMAHRADLAADLVAKSDYGRWLAVLLTCPAAILLVAGLPLLVLGPRSPSRDRARFALAVVGPLVVAGAVAALAGGAAFQHYIQLAIVPVALAAGGAAGALALRVRSGAFRAAIAAAVLVSTAAAAGQDRLRLQWRSRDWAGYDGPLQTALRDRMDALDPARGPIFVWGIHPDLYVTTGRAPATRFVSAGWLVGTFTGKAPAGRPEAREFVPGSRELFLSDFDAARPVFVVDSAPAGIHGFGQFPIDSVPGLTERLRRDYDREEGPGGYVLWKRR